MKNSIECFELLISHGADVNIKNNLNSAVNDCTECFELLISHGADVNIRNSPEIDLDEKICELVI